MMPNDHLTAGKRTVHVVLPASIGPCNSGSVPGALVLLCRRGLEA